MDPVQEPVVLGFCIVNLNRNAVLDDRVDDGD